MAEGNVITALAKVQAEIGGIGKTRPKDSQLTYAYRGIDAIAAAIQPLFGREGVVVVPTETTIEKTVDVTINSKPWVDVFVRVEWTIYGPGGVADCVTAVTFGVGRDNSDKQLNKAMTMAYKNLVLRVLSIGDPQDDADQPQHQNNATEARRAPQADPKKQPLALPIDALLARLEMLDKLDYEPLEAEAEKYNLSLTLEAFTADHEWANYIYSLLPKAAG